MTFLKYIKDNLLNIFFWFLFIIIVDVMLLFLAVNQADIILLNTIYLIFILIYHGLSFYKRRKYLKELYKKFEDLKDKNLICEFIEEPTQEDYKIFYEIIKESGESLNNSIAENEKFSKEYSDYIEKFVHEIKLPISVIKLIVERLENDDSRKIKEETAKIEFYIEQVLYFARSGNVENDYFIKETNVEKLVKNVIIKHKSSFIERKIAPNINCGDIYILTDSKWFEFILSQIVDNAIKYSSEKHKKSIEIFTNVTENSIDINIKNFGYTIPKSDLNRIFEKGFTGENGRKIQHSTGIGLYLVKTLCDKLGHKISVKSQDNETTFTISVFK